MDENETRGTLICEGISATTPNEATKISIDYVRSLTPDEREGILFALLRDLLDEQEGHGPIYFSMNGQRFGYWVTPMLENHYREKNLARLPPDIAADLRRFDNHAIAPDADSDPLEAWYMKQVLEDL